MKNKKNLIIIGTVIGLIIIILAIFLMPTSEKRLSNMLESKGKSFYHNFYNELSDALTEEKVKEEMSKLSLNGITLTLDNLSKEEKISKIFRRCDKNNTKVIVYPESPYNINNYKAEVKLDC